MKRAEFRKLISPLVRSGHLVQDYRGGFKTVTPLQDADLWEVKRDYLRELVSQYPVAVSYTHLTLPTKAEV